MLTLIVLDDLREYSDIDTPWATTGIEVQTRHTLALDHQWRTLLSQDIVHGDTQV